MLALPKRLSLEILVAGDHGLSLVARFCKTLCGRSFPAAVDQELAILRAVTEGLDVGVHNLAVGRGGHGWPLNRHVDTRQDLDRRSGNTWDRKQVGRGGGGRRFRGEPCGLKRRRLFLVHPFGPCAR